MTIQPKRDRGRPTNREKVSSVPRYRCSFCARPYLSERGKTIHEQNCKSKPPDVRITPFPTGSELDQAKQQIAENKPSPIDQASSAAAPDQTAKIIEFPKPQIDSLILEVAIATMFDVIASRAGDHWKLSVKEVQALAGVWKAVIDYYLPQIGSKVLLIAVMQTALILGPKAFKHGTESRKRRAGSTDDYRASGKRENDTAKGAS